MRLKLKDAEDRTTTDLNSSGEGGSTFPARKPRKKVVPSRLRNQIDSDEEDKRDVSVSNFKKLPTPPALVDGSVKVGPQLGKENMSVSCHHYVC